MGHTSIDTGHTNLAAANTPGDDADQLPPAVVLAHHRAAAVTFAGILALLAAGADEARVKFEAGTEPGPPHLLLACDMTDDRYVHLLQYVLVLAIVTESVFAPAGGPASVVW